MLPGHRFPPSNLRDVPRPQGSRFKPQYSRPQGSRITDVMFPGHRVPESILSYVPRLQGSRIKPQSCSQSTVFPESKASVMLPQGHSAQISTTSKSRCHIPRPQVSRINLSSCSQAQGSRIKPQFMFPGHRVPESKLSHVPRHSFENLNRCHVPRPQVTRITLQSCSQATGSRINRIHVART